MLDVTDRHCRYFHRLLAPQVRLYTEMVTTGALLHGSVARHLAHHAAEHPLALQLGGSDPRELAQCVRLARQWGFDEINLNCGCPSDKVQQGAFGACLMAQPQTVVDAWCAMQEAAKDTPVTIKHRLGLGHEVSYECVRDFVGRLFDAGCRVFIVHARNAILQGLSPKDNRNIPPLRYDLARQLKRDFADGLFVLNGGLMQVQACLQTLPDFDGIMLGRAAWHTPGILAQLSQQLWPHIPARPEAEVVQKMEDYARAEITRHNTPLRLLTRPLLGWMHGRSGARHWRRMLSDAHLLASQNPALIGQAWQAMQQIPHTTQQADERQTPAPQRPLANPECTL